MESVVTAIRVRGASAKRIPQNVVQRNAARTVAEIRVGRALPVTVANLETAYVIPTLIV